MQARVCSNDGATETFSDGTVFTCPPAELICSRNTPIIEVEAENVPPSCKNLIITKFEVYRSTPHMQGVMILVPLVQDLPVQHIA